MKEITFIRKIIILMGIILTYGISVSGQEEAQLEIKPRPVENTFESIWLGDNQTVMVPYKGTLEMDMLHRFGTVKNGYDDFWGLYASSNIRIGFNYVPAENLQLGFGFTKERLLWDLNAKYAIFRQGRDGGSPFSVTYYVNMAIDTRDGQFHEEFNDRLTYFHQIMVARKLSDVFSLQTSLSVSHFNFQEPGFSSDGELLGKLNADHLGLAFLGRYLIKDGTSLFTNIDIPMTGNDYREPQPNYSFGIEFTSSSHAFQIFIGNYQSIIPQFNNVRNTNEAGETEFLIGFNITRLWSF
jgi:hypothetical protein